MKMSIWEQVAILTNRNRNDGRPYEDEASDNEPNRWWNRNWIIPYLDQGARSGLHESRDVRICPAPRGTGNRGTRRGTLAVRRQVGSSAHERARDRSRAAARHASRPRTPRPSPHSPPPWRARAPTIGPAATSSQHQHYSTKYVLLHYYLQCRKLSPFKNWL